MKQMETFSIQYLHLELDRHDSELCLYSDVKLSFNLMDANNDKTVVSLFAFSLKNHLNHLKDGCV